jgi:iron transport multicopper oxidase
VDVKTLNTVDGYPILVDGTVADNDNRNYFVGGTVLQRPSVLQKGNFVFGAFGGHCDLFNYTGSVVGIDITKRKVNTMFVMSWGPQSPAETDWYKGKGGGAGIWQSGLGLATDGPRIFLVTVCVKFPC